MGGEASSIIIHQMRPYGRISVCGSISAYNEVNLPKGKHRIHLIDYKEIIHIFLATIIQPAMVGKMLEMKGFVVSQFKARRFEGIQQNLEWILEGKLKYRETITEGFQDTPKALIGILNGENIGKAVVRIKGSHVDTLPVDFKGALHIFKKKEVRN